MPSCYTAILIEKKLSFKEFAILCSRHFGALIMMRDEPLDAQVPERFEPSSYHLEEIDKCKAALAIPNKSEEELKMLYSDYVERERDSHIKYEKEKMDKRNMLDTMLASIEGWTPPTRDHTGLKSFMISQIQETISHDCKPMELVLPSFSEWKSITMNRNANELQYHAKEYAEEVQRTEQRNLWLKQLRDSIK